MILTPACVALAARHFRSRDYCHRWFFSLLFLLEAIDMISHREVTPRVMFPHHSTNHLGHPHDDPTLTLIAGIAEAAVAEVSSRPRSRGGQVTVDEGTMTELQEHQHDTSISRPHSSPNRPRNDPPRSASPFNPTSELSFERQRPKTSGGHGVRGNASMSPDAGREARGARAGGRGRLRRDRPRAGGDTRGMLLRQDLKGRRTA